MRYPQTRCACALLFSCLLASGTPVISEFMADNRTTLYDEVGD